MSLLIEKTLILAISILLSVGALLIFIGDVIPLLKAILEAYAKTLHRADEPDFSPLSRGFVPERFLTWSI